eukprot:gene2655-3062_t
MSVTTIIEFKLSLLLMLALSMLTTINAQTISAKLNTTLPASGTGVFTPFMRQLKVTVDFTVGSSSQSVSATSMSISNGVVVTFNPTTSQPSCTALFFMKTYEKTPTITVSIQSGQTFNLPYTVGEWIEPEAMPITPIVNQISTQIIGGGCDYALEFTPSTINASMNYYGYYSVDGDSSDNKATLVKRSPPTYFVETTRSTSPQGGPSSNGVSNLAGVRYFNSALSTQCFDSFTTAFGAQDELYGPASPDEPYQFMFFQSHKKVSNFYISPRESIKDAPYVIGATENTYYYSELKTNGINQKYVSLTAISNPNITKTFSNIVQNPIVDTAFIVKLVPPLSAPDPVNPYLLVEHLFENGFLYIVTGTFTDFTSIHHMVVASGNNVLLYDKDINSASYSKRFILPYNIGASTIQVYSVAKDGSTKTHYNGGTNITFTTAIPPTQMLNSATVNNRMVSVSTTFSNYPIGVVPIVKTPVQSQLKFINGFFNNDHISIFNLQSSFPYGYNGDRVNINHLDQFQVTNDTPTMPFAIVSNQAYSSVTTKDQIPLLVVVGQEKIQLDILNPIVQVDLTLTALLVDVNDGMGVGIGETTCAITLGPFTFPVISKYRRTGDVVNGQYVIPFNFPAIYCSSHFNILCADIHGNVLDINSTSQFASNYFKKTTPDFCSSTPSIGYVYNPSGQAGKMGFTVILGAVSAPIDQLTLTLYQDRENTVAVRSIPLTLSQSESSSKGLVMSPHQLFTGSDTLVPVTVQTTLYFGLTIKRGGSSMTYNTQDIEYFNSLGNTYFQPTQVKSDSSINFYPPTYALLPKFTLSYLNASAISVLIDTPSSSIVNFTIAINDDRNPRVNRIIHAMQPTTPNPVELNLNIDNLAPFRNAFVESACSSDHCESYPYYGYLSTWPVTVSPPVYSSTVTVTSQPTTIDVTKANRKVTLVAKITTTSALLDPMPMIYITENYSNDKLQCQSVYVSQVSIRGAIIFTVTCDIDIPLNWGTRGISFSVWQISYEYHTAGTFSTGPSPLTLTSSIGPNIETATFYIGSDHIILKGWNLFYIGTTSTYTPILVANSIPLPTFYSLDGFNGELTVPTGFNPLENFDISLNGNVINVRVLGCMRSNCSGNGQCIGGKCNGICEHQICNCVDPWTGPSCNMNATDLSMNLALPLGDPTSYFRNYSSNNLEIPIDQDSLDTSFSMTLISVDELRVDDSTVISYTLSKWTPLQPPPANNSTASALFKSLSILGDLEVRVDLYTESNIIQWANESWNLPQNSFKYTVRLSNYSFESPLNRLVFKYQVTASSSDPSGGGGSNLHNGGSSINDIHWIQVDKNQLSLHGRFSNRLVVDGKQISNSNAVSKDKADGVYHVAIEVPAFTTYAELDPDFSVLLNKKEESKDKKDYTILIIIIVCVVVGVAIIVAILVTIAKKNTYVRTKLFRLKSIRMKSMKSEERGDVFKN